MFTLRTCTALAVLLALVPAAPAQTWTGLTATELWNTAGNWNPITVPNSTTAAVTFSDVTNSAFAFVILQSSVQAQSLTFTNTANTALNYSITSSGNPVLSGVTSITVGSAVATTDTINLNALSSGSLVYPSGGSLTITNNAALGASPTLVIGPKTVIGTPGTGGITVAGSGYTRISGSFAGGGSQVISGLTKNGTGQLDLNLSASSSIGTLTVNAGPVTVGGGSLSLTNSTAGFSVGSGSAATLTVSGGAVVSSGGQGNEIVDGPAGTGAIVTGAGSQFHTGFNVLVGVNGSGNLTVQNGGAFSAIDQVHIGTNSGSTGTLLVQSGGTFTASYLPISTNPGSNGSATVTDAGSAATVTTLDIGTGGNGALTVAAGGAFTTYGVTTLYSTASSITVNGGTLSVGSLAMASGTRPNLALSDPAGAAALTVGTSNSSTTYAGPIVDAAGGPGTVNKVGTGTLTLTGHLTNTGGYTATGGTIDFSAAVVQPGSGSLTAAAGATIKYDNGARVFGGFLHGPGTHVVTGGAAFTGTSSNPSAITSVIGPATFTDFSNGGAFSVAAGLTTVPSLSSFINQGSGSITIGAASKVNAADFQSYGLLTISPATSGPPTLLTNTGSAPLFLNGGSRTFIGTPATATANAAGLDLGGHNLVVAGGLFVNNGFVADSTGAPGSVIVDFGALYKGAGTNFVPIVTQNGGKVQAGNSPGSMGFGKFVFGPGGVNNYVFAIDDATGQAGPSPDAQGLVSGWGLVKAVKALYGSATTSGNFVWTATPSNKLTVALDTLVNPTMVGTDVGGPMANFDPAQAYAWPAVYWDGTYSGPTDAASLTASTAFDTSGFLNATAGTFGWSLDVPDHALSLTYTPTAVPEPGTLTLAGVAAIGWVTFWRRRWAPVRVVN